MSSILDADMTTLARHARRGWTWWVEELAGLLPARTRRWSGNGAALIAHFDGTGFELRRQGRPVAAPRGRPAVALALPGNAALCRPMVLPALNNADLRAMVELDADRLLPFPPGAALIDVEAGPRLADGTQAVTVAGLPAEPARIALAAAEAQGLEVSRLGIAANDGVRFDFLPAWRARAGERASSGRRFWWAAVALLFVGNVTVLVGRDVYQVRAYEELVSVHGQAAATARLLRARVIAEDQRRRSLADRQARQDPLTVLTAATRAIPDSAWVHRLAWSGSALRLTGYKPGALDLAAVLRRTPPFVAVRPATPDVGAANALAQPFDLIADVRQ